MTLENSKRLYEHYIESGQDKRAEEVLLKYPELNSKPKSKKEEKEEEVSKE